MFRRPLSTQEEQKITHCAERYTSLAEQMKAIKEEQDMLLAEIFSFVNEEPGIELALPMGGQRQLILKIGESFSFDEGVLKDLAESGAVEMQPKYTCNKAIYNRASREEQAALNLALTRKPGTKSLKIR